MAADAAPRFVHVPALAAAADEIELAGDEARYLARVVRARAGERVTASDGAGTTAALELLSVGATVHARIRERAFHERAATLELWCGAPEGERGDWLVEKVAELGAAALRPVDFARGAWPKPEARAARWERLADAALRQSCAAWRLRVLPALALAEALAGLQDAPAGRWACRPDGESAGERAVPAGRLVAVVGPSSGLDAAELKLFSDNGFDAVSLGSSRLRAETAAVAVAALWAARRPADRRAG